MRILIVSPGPLAVPGGNTVSVLRLQEGLIRAGHRVEICEADRVDPSAFAPGSLDVVHGFHVRKGGLAAMEVARSCGARLVVTLTGTETSLDWQDSARRAQILSVLETDPALIALRSSHLEELRGLSGLALTGAVVIPQTIRLGKEPFDLAGSLGLQPEVPLVLLPGGLRPVKGQDWALDALEDPAHGTESWHLVLMGPVLDPQYGALLERRVQGLKRAHYAGSIEPAAMGACFEACDLVLNTSETEGESNAILEAMFAGRVVLARSNPGNRALIQEGSTGSLFEDRAGLSLGIQRLLGDADLRGRLSRAAKDFVGPRTDPAVEIEGHLDLYSGHMGASDRA